jgi:hypothetical protein
MSGKCIRCGNSIHPLRLEILPDTVLCSCCSNDVGGEFEIKIDEENLGSSIQSTPVVKYRRRTPEELV